MELDYIEVDPSIGALVEMNDGFCPCAVNKTSETFCPCLEFREGGECQCGRYARKGAV